MNELAGIIRLRTEILSAVERGVKDHPLGTVALIGSASPQSPEGSHHSDIDVLAVGEHEFLLAVKESIANVITTEGFAAMLATGWGIVSPQTLGSNVIHLHAAPPGVFRKKSALYRYSVAKYASIVGPPLSAYRDFTRPAVACLLSDELGPKKLLDRLTSVTSIEQMPKMDVLSSDGTHQLRITATPIDLFLYASLHSMRNILRARNAYVEFAALSELGTLWQAANGPAQASANRLVFFKEQRRKGNSIDHCTTEIHTLGEEFLQAAITWISGW